MCVCVCVHIDMRVCKVKVSCIYHKCSTSSHACISVCVVGGALYVVILCGCIHRHTAFSVHVTYFPFALNVAYSSFFLALCCGITRKV